MKIVKLTFNFDFPIFRQTENNSQIWGDYKFVIDENLEECDYWIVYADYKLTQEVVKCNPNNIIFIPAEGYNTSPKFNQFFLDQFGLLITVQRDLKHKNILYSHNANPWFVGKSYDELSSNNVQNKSKLISVVSSNKSFTEGHVKRLEFVQQLKNHFGDKLDVFGRGINDFDDKWDVLADYKYTIAIENDFCDNWVTEKYFDCIYANTLQFYYGCPNLESIVNKNSFIRIDINNIEESILIIENAIKNDEFSKRSESIFKQKHKSLNEDQFFPWIVSILDNQTKYASKELVKLKLNIKNEILILRIKKKMIKLMKNKLKKILNFNSKKKTTNEKIQFDRCKPWFAANGDQTLRLNYNLNENAIVLDLGGYKGEFATEIHCKYNATVYVFEPVSEFYTIIKNKFSNNAKVKPFPFGLAGSDGEMQISMSDNSSSVFLKTENSETIQLKSIVNFIQENQITKVDLIKINIEGGEYEVLEALLDANLISIFDNIQVQFHDFLFEGARERMQAIQQKLAKTHSLTYQYEFVWENWKLK